MWNKYIMQTLKYCCELAKGSLGFQMLECTEAYILESVLPKGHLEETNRSIYLEACLVQPARCDLLNDRAYFYELTKARKESLGSWRLLSFHSRPQTTYNKCWKGKMQRSRIIDCYLCEGTLRTEGKNRKDFLLYPPEAAWFSELKVKVEKEQLQRTDSVHCMILPKDLWVLQLVNGNYQAYHPSVS